MNPLWAFLYASLSATFFAIGFYLAYRLRFWEARTQVNLDREREAAAQDARVEEVFRTMREAGGPQLPEEPESSPLGPVIPTPDELEAEKTWKSIFKRRRRA